MHGSNPLRKKELDPKGRLQVHEVWRTIQGEGPLAGMPAVFLRLSGCNLACWFCDTEWDDKNDPILPWQEVMGKVLQAADGPTNLLVITGGEPFRQNFVPLATKLIEEHGWIVQIETNGVYWDPIFDPLTQLPQFQIVCSPKTAKVHPKIEEYCNCWKYVVKRGEVSGKDGLPMSGWKSDKRILVARPPHGVPKSRILVQPCDEGQTIKNKGNQDTAVEVAHKFGYRVSIQGSKVLGVP